jgi:hypothetical protein
MFANPEKIAEKGIEHIGVAMWLEATYDPQYGSREDYLDYVQNYEEEEEDSWEEEYEEWRDDHYQDVEVYSETSDYLEHTKYN